MNRTVVNRCGLVALGVLAVAITGADWRQFRGPHGTSVSRDEQPPERWTEAENVAWKAPLPGKGASSPIVVKDCVVLTCSAGVRDDRLVVLCVDAASGAERWRREFWATGRTMTHPTSAVAAPTPASDGERIFAFYSSNDLICLDLAGNLLWYRGLAVDFPKAGNDVGMSSSPVVAGNSVIVQVENQGDSFAAGLDTRTGETRWRVARPREANWASPATLPRTIDGQHVVLLSCATNVTALNADTGEEVWRYEMSCGTIPSIASTDNCIYVPGGGLTALELAAGATSPSLKWKSNKLNPSPSSPIVDGERILAMNNAGVLTCAKAETGDVLWQLRVGGTHWSTPVLVGDRVYCLNQDGEMRVVKISADKGEVIHSFSTGETLQGSPAVAGGALFFRSNKQLWKIARP